MTLRTEENSPLFSKDSYEEAYQYKYERVAKKLSSGKLPLIPVIPITMTEAWILADKY